MWELWDINLRLRVTFFLTIVNLHCAVLRKQVRIAGHQLFFFVFIPHNSDFFFGTVYPGIPTSFLRIVSHKVQFWGKKLSILIFSCSISLLDSQFWLCISQLLIYSTQFREKKSELQDVTLQLQKKKKKKFYFLFLFSSRNKLPYVSLYRSKEKQLN